MAGAVMQLPPDQLWTVFQALRAISDWPRARYAAERMLAAVENGDEPATRRLRMAAHTFLADALRHDPDGQADLVRSQKLYGLALDAGRALAKELDTPEARRDVSVSLNNVANAARARGELVAAERLFAESLEIRRALAKELDTPEARRDVSVSLLLLGQSAASEGEFNRARQMMSEALAIVTALFEQTGEAERLRDRALCHLNIASTEAAQGDAAAARASLVAARRIADVFGRRQPISDAADIISRADALMTQIETSGESTRNA